MSVENHEISRIEQKFAVKQIGHLQYEGLHPLSKPNPKSRGVYGGNLCAQTILVALQTVSKDFVPHSLHSYFIAAGDDSIPCQYQVEELSNGKNFANRLVRLLQNNELKYIVTISLTKRNNLKKAASEFAKTGKGARPFEYQLPPDDVFYKYKPADLQSRQSHNNRRLMIHKIPPAFYEPQEIELTKAPGERSLSFYIKLNEDKPLSENFKYASMGLITDSLYLSTISRILHIPDPEHKVTTGYNSHFFSVSLDHSIYFHDDDFDPSKWLYFHYSSPRFANNRAFFTGNYYNKDGRLVATIMQEGLVFFKNDVELQAKL